MVIVINLPRLMRCLYISMAAVSLPLSRYGMVERSREDVRGRVLVRC